MHVIAHVKGARWCVINVCWKALRAEMAEMESADLDIGDFSGDAVPSEVKVGGVN